MGVLTLCLSTQMLSLHARISRQRPFMPFTGSRFRLELHEICWRCSRCTMALAACSWLPGYGQSRHYRPIGLTSRIDEILLSFMPCSFTCK